MQHKCPNCSSDNITSDKIQFEGEDIVVVPMSCGCCKEIWDAIFVFQKYENKND